MKKSLVVVGGGFVGVTVAKGLQSSLDVTLVEPRSHFVHAPAMIRGLVDRSVDDAALIEYDGLLPDGTLIRAAANGVDASGVTLDDGRRVDADFVVIATGSSNGVFTPAGASLEEFRSIRDGVGAQLRNAQRVVIVGAGAVGIELAGEIAHALPQINVTLVTSGTSLLPDSPRKLGRMLTRKLEQMGVELVLGARVEQLPRPTEPGAGPVRLDDGRELEADLVFATVGARPNTDLLSTLPGATRTPSGRIAVDEFLRPSEFVNVFAAGDAIDAGDGMTVYATTRHEAWLRKALTALATGRSFDRIKPYRAATRSPLLVPLGPDRGASYLMVGTFGDRITRAAKGGDLQIPKWRKILGAAPS
ncbi:MAG: FAD-dependent oxidoreductase [Actinomycetota bacterium]